MRRYETAFLLAPDLEEEETAKVIQEMADVVTGKKGKIEEIEKWGKKRLAYPIEKHEEAFYVFFHYEGKPDVPSELERQFRQTESVIRYLTLRKDGQVEKKRGKAGKARKKPEVRAEKEAASETPEEPEKPAPAAEPEREKKEKEEE